MKYDQEYNGLMGSVDLALKESDTLEEVAEEVLTNVVVATINAYQQKLSVGIQDSASDLLDTFKQSISQSLIDAARGWRVPNREPFLFPRGCRFCFTKGQSTLFIIEQEPQIRSLRLSEDLVFAGGYKESFSRHSLSLPYVVFVAHFKEGVFSTVYCGWRSMKLGSLNDMLAMPFLPNIHDNLAVCMGNTFSCDSEPTMADAVEKVISHFWQSNFNSDLVNGWQKKFNADNRLRSVASWEGHTIENPLFILEVPLEYDGRRTVKQLFDVLTCHEAEPDENSLRHKLSESIDNCADALFSKILRYFKKTKFDKHHPKDVKDSLTSSMKDAISDLASLILVIKHDLEKLSKEIDRQKTRPQIQAKGPLWGQYSS